MSQLHGLTGLFNVEFALQLLSDIILHLLAVKGLILLVCEEASTWTQECWKWKCYDGEYIHFTCDQNLDISNTDSAGKLFSHTKRLYTSEYDAVILIVVERRDVAISWDTSYSQTCLSRSPYIGPIVFILVTLCKDTMYEMTTC